MEPKLKPCAHCGETTIFIGEDRPGYTTFYYVQCGNTSCGCGIRTKMYENKQDAVSTWNKRVTYETENVDLIPGEVYYSPQGDDGFIFILKDTQNKDCISLCHYCSYSNSFTSNEELLCSVNNSMPATPDQKAFLFKILENNNKKFDKDKIELIDVAYWSAKEFDPIITRDDADQSWALTSFKKFDITCDFPFITHVDYWKMAIPFNEQTKKLISTSGEPSEIYIFKNE